MNLDNHESRLRIHRPSPDDRHALQRTGFDVIQRPWSVVRAIMSEFSQDVKLLKMALAAGHGIVIEEGIPGHDPMLWFTVDSITKGKLADAKIPNPTMLQLIGTAQVWSDVSAKDCEAKFRAMLTGDN